MAETLEQIGFSAAEIYRCDAYSNGIMVIPASIAGEDARLVLDTEQALDLTLSLAHVRRRDIPYERRNETWGTSPLVAIECLGKSRPPDVVWVRGKEADTKEKYTVGTLGASFIDGTILGLDPIEWKAGLSLRSEIRNGFKGATHRLPFLSNILANLPVTTALRDEYQRDTHPVFIVDTGRVQSVLSLEYVEQRWSWRERRRARRVHRKNKGKLHAHWLMPDDSIVHLDMSVFEECRPSYLDNLGVDAVDGYLGLDFLYQWIPVFDLGGRELALFDLMGRGDAETRGGAEREE